MGHPKIILRPTSMLRKQAGIMRKLLGLWGTNVDASKGTNRNPKPKPIMTRGQPDFLANDKGLHCNFITRRQVVLNRHFTEIISDVLANSLKKDLSDSGVRITSIETKAWNKGVKVFYTTERSFDPNLHDELNSLITKLRYAVSERQLIGRVPMVNFVYDEAVSLDRVLDNVLERARPNNSVEETDLMTSASSGIQASREQNCKKSKFFSNHFSAPDDMSNTSLGLDYPSLYNQIATKLERGRAQSSRLSNNVSLMSQTPIFQMPQENIDEEDPTKRVQKMQSFLISQKKKNDIAAKRRRERELLHRDLIKWDVPEEGTGETRDTV